jgi:lipoate-protein ligase A
MAVVVGGLRGTFDFDAMVSLLKVPSEKFRDKVHKTMRDNLITVELEVGTAPCVKEIPVALARRSKKALGPLEVRRAVDAEMRAEMDRLWRRYSSDEWLRRRGRRSPTRRVMVREGVELLSGTWKAPGGLVRADATLREGRLEGLPGGLWRGRG